MMDNGKRRPILGTFIKMLISDEHRRDGNNYLSQYRAHRILRCLLMDMLTEPTKDSAAKVINFKQCKRNVLSYKRFNDVWWRLDRWESLPDDVRAVVKLIENAARLTSPPHNWQQDKSSWFLRFEKNEVFGMLRARKTLFQGLQGRLDRN